MKTSIVETLRKNCKSLNDEDKKLLCSVYDLYSTRSWFVSAEILNYDDQTMKKTLVLTAQFSSIFMTSEYISIKEFCKEHQMAFRVAFLQEDKDYLKGAYQSEILQRPISDYEVSHVQTWA